MTRKMEFSKPDDYYWRELPQVSFLSKQKTCFVHVCRNERCRDKTFVATKIILVARVTHDMLLILDRVINFGGVIFRSGRS